VLVFLLFLLAVLAVVFLAAGVLLPILVLAAAPMLLLVPVVAAGVFFEDSCKALGGVLHYQFFSNDRGDVKRIKNWVITDV
jgi:hypothetical protein